MELLQHIMSQGVEPEAAAELVERKKKNPKLLGVAHKGKFVTLNIPSAKDVEKFNEMMESGIAPSANTDREFLSGNVNGSQFEKNPAQGDFYKKVTEAHGGSVTGKKYLSQLARFPGDPEAWVSDRHDVQKRCEERGWGADGAGVKVEKKKQEKPYEPTVAVNEEIVDRVAAQELEGQTVTGKDYRLKKDAIRERICPRNRKHLLKDTRQIAKEAKK